MAVPQPVAGLTHDVVLASGAPGNETLQGLMVAGGMKHYSCQPYTPFAPTAREGEATNRDLALPAVWELQQDWSGGVGKLIERKVEDNGYAYSHANSTTPTPSVNLNTNTGPTLYTGLAGCVMPAAALTDAGTNDNVKQFIEFSGSGTAKYYFLDSAATPDVWVYDDDGDTPSKVNSGAGAGLGAYAGKQIYTDGSTLYVTRGAAAAVRKTTNGDTWTDYQVNSVPVYADFLCVRDDGALACVTGATLTPGAGIAGSPTHPATTIGWTGTTATNIVFFKGALWIGKPEGLFSWYEGKVDKRFDTMENYCTTNFTKMAVHNSLLYFNVRNQLFYTDGNNYTQVFPNDAGGFANISCMFPTSGPLLLGAKLLTFAAGQTGAYFPGTMADDNTVGTIAWADPGNVAALDNAYATAALTATTDVSHYLKCTNFGIQLPTSCAMAGVQVDIYTEFGYCGNFNARLVIGGTISGDTKTYLYAANPKVRAFPAPGTDRCASLGGKAELWGLTPTRANVVASTFGVVISATGKASTVRIDAVRITVFYTPLDTSLEQLYMFWGPEAPGLNPLWSDDNGTHPVLAVGATSLYDSTGVRIYFCCNDAWYTNKIHYMSMTPRYWPSAFSTGNIDTSKIDLTEFSAGFKTIPKWWYEVLLNVRDPLATTFAMIEYCIDSGAWCWLEDQYGAPATLVLDDRIVGAYFPLDTTGTFCQLRLHLWTTSSSNVAKITHVTLRGLTMPRVRYQYAFPANCDHTVPTLTPIADSGEAVREFIRDAAAQGFPCRFQDPWGDWHLVKFREPSPMDVIADAEKPQNNARQRMYAAVQCVLVEVDELDAYGDLKAWSLG